MLAQATPNTIEALAAKYASQRRKTLDEILHTDHRRNISIASALRPLAEVGLNLAAIIKAIWASVMRLLRRIAAVFGVQLAEPAKTPEIPEQAKAEFTSSADDPAGEAKVQAAAEAAEVALAKKVKEVMADSLDEQKLLEPMGDVYLRLRLADLGASMLALREEAQARTRVLQEQLLINMPDGMTVGDVPMLMEALLRSSDSVEHKLRSFEPALIELARGVIDLKEDLLDVEDRFSNFAIAGLQAARHVGSEQLEQAAQEQIKRFATPEMAARIVELGASEFRANDEKSPQGQAFGDGKLALLDVNSPKSDSAGDDSVRSEEPTVSQNVVPIVTASMPRSMRFKGVGIADAEPPKFGQDDHEEGDAPVARQRGG